MNESIIPDEKTAAVTRALREAFGVTTFEDIGVIKNGLTSTLVFRIVVRGSPFLLRINMRKGDVARHFTCMRAAAAAGLAPQVWYTNIDDRVSITAFVDAVSFPVTDALSRLPAALRNLHSLPPFPEVPHHINTSCTFLINKGTALDEFIRNFQQANIPPPDDNEEFFARYAQVAAVYPHNAADLVSSHNDLFKPDNILFDGHRVWLIDWEAAFLNDRYADLAVLANLVVNNDAEERVYLREYFGQPPEEYELARFFLMQQIAHMFYAMAFLLLGSSGKPVDWSAAVPEFSDFRRRIWAGEVDLADKHTKTIYGRLHWERLLSNVRKARFNEALRIVAERRLTAPAPVS
jgi:aminoglycoside phosphotransferase (APT) family kinase protein